MRGLLLICWQLKQIALRLLPREMKLPTQLLRNFSREVHLDIGSSADYS